MDFTQCLILVVICTVILVCLPFLRALLGKWLATTNFDNYINNFFDSVEENNKNRKGWK